MALRKKDKKKNPKSESPIPSKKHNKKVIKKNNGKGKIGDKLFSLIILAGILVTVCLLLYPTFIDAVSCATQSTTIGSYSNKLKSADIKKIDRDKEKAREYNEYIRKRQKFHPFYYSGTGDDDKRYQQILNVNHDGVMGYIEIPRIGVSLPIGHGTSSRVLDSGAGHVHGTSVPIGGKGTHSVISAHTGLQSAKMFTDINKLKKGDEFSIHVLNEIHYYRVTGSQVELPDPANKYLQVQDGKDLVTLYTCTPYGINTHRLLVHAEAIKTKKVKKLKADKIHANDWGTAMTQKALALASIPLMILLFGLSKIFGYKPKTRRLIRRRKGSAGVKAKPKGSGKKIKHTKKKKSAEEKTKAENIIKANKTDNKIKADDMIKAKTDIPETESVKEKDQVKKKSGNSVPAPDFSILFTDNDHKKEE